MRRVIVVWLLVAVGLGVASAPARAAFGDPPVINGISVSNVTTTRATFNASVTYNEKAGTWWFSYCRSFECPTGSETPHQTDDPQTDQEAVTPRPESWPVTNLRPSTTYQLTFHAANDSHFFTPTTRTITFRTADPVLPSTPVPPSAQTQAVTGITPNAATFNGIAVPGTTGATSTPSSLFFEWGVAGGAFDHTTDAEQAPADATPYPTSAPVTGLTPNRSYQVRLVAVRGGQRATGNTVTFQTPAIPDCPADTSYRTVRLGHVVAVGCLRDDGHDRYVAQNAIRLNGVLFEPSGGRGSNNHRFGCSSSACGALQDYLDHGNKLYLDQPGDALGTTGDWTMSAGPLVGMHTGTFDVRNIDWSSDDPLLTAGVDRSVELIDFPLAGQLTFTPDADGTSRLGLLVGMPVALGGVTGETAVQVNPGGDLTFDRLRIEVGEVAVKGFSLGGLKFVYDRTQELWEGAANVQVPTPTKISVGADVTVIHGRFGQFSGFVDSLNQHLAYGVYLQKIGVRFGLQPILLGGDIGLTAGPKIEGVGAIGLDGTFDLRAEPGRESRELPGGFHTVVDYPGYLQLGGSVSVFSIPLRSAFMRFYFTNEAWFEAGGTIGVDIKAGDITAFRLGGDVFGSLHGTTLEMSGDVGLTVFDFDVARADAILSTRGIGACGKVLDGAFAVGGFMRWGEAGHAIWYCDMTRLHNEVGVSSAQAGSGVLSLPPHASQALVRFSSSTGAPRIRLHGPDGRTIDTPAPGVGNSSAARSFISFRDEQGHNTDVLLANTGSGRWTYETLPGSAPVTKLQTARPLPKVSVKASIARKGRTATLRWRLRHIAGQRVTFMEAGPGAPPRIIKVTTAARGHKRFRPFLTRERTRRIVAIVEQDGKPRARVQVARYTAPKLPRVARVRGLRAVRHGSRVIVTWKKMPGAREYRVLLRERSGRRTLHVVKRPRLTLRGARGRAARTLSVRAVGLDGRVAKSRSAKVKKARRRHH